MKETFDLVSQRKADCLLCAIKCNYCIILLSRRQDASYPIYLKRGKTGILDKGSLQDGTFFSSMLKENTQRKAKMADLIDKESPA